VPRLRWSAPSSEVVARGRRFPQLAAEVGAGASLEHIHALEGRLRPALDGRIDADFLVNAAISVAALATGTST